MKKLNNMSDLIEQKVKLVEMFGHEIAKVAQIGHKHDDIKRFDAEVTKVLSDIYTQGKKDAVEEILEEVDLFKEPHRTYFTIFITKLFSKIN